MSFLNPSSLTSVGILIPSASSADRAEEKLLYSIQVTSSTSSSECRRTSEHTAITPEHEMQAAVLVVIVLVLTMAGGQPTSECSEQEQTSCAAKQASSERSAIIDRVESAMSAIMPRLREIEAQNSAIQRELGDYASRFETIESQNSDILQEQRCSSPEQMFRQNGSHQYMLGLSRLNWAQARERCHQCGFSLARIESYTEQQYIRKWLTDIDAVPSDREASIWTDGTDQSHEGCWLWTYPSLTLFSSGFTAWNTGEPNNENSEHCNSLRGAEMKWNDIDCLTKLTFLCKKVIVEATAALPSLDEVKATTFC